MRRHLFTYKYPTITLSITLMASILLSFYCHAFLPVKQVLTITTLCWGLACISVFLPHHTYRGKIRCRPFKYCHVFIIHLTLFIWGFTYTSLYQERALGSHAFYPTYTVHQLSPIDRCKLKAQATISNIKEEMKKSHIDHQELAVISAMALGEKSMLTGSTKNAFSVTGASHVLAISGLHIGIIFQLFFLLLGGKRRYLYSVPLSLSIVWTYVFFIGLPTSAVRSATMISIYGFALISRRKNMSINSLFISLILLLIVNPLSLFDISFQMSFLSVGSILLLYPLIQGLIRPHLPIVRWVWSATAISISAQIGTLPIIVYYFGRISCYSILTNLIAIPAATLILYFSLSFILLSSLSHLGIAMELLSLLSKFIAHLLFAITKITNESLTMLSSLPGASIDNVKINILQLYLIYMSIAAGYLLIRKLHQYRLRRTHLLASCRKHCNSLANQTLPKDLCPKSDRHKLSS